MPGILDFLNTDDGKLGVALLAAAGPSMQPMGFGQRLQGAMQSMDADKLEKMKMGLLQSQIDENKSQADQRTAALELARRKQAALPSILGGSSGAAAPGQIQPQMMGGLLPMFSQPVGVSQVPQAQGQGGINVALAAQNGYSPEEILKLDALRHIGQDKVARTIKSVGPDGREYETQLDEYGRPVGQPMAQYRAPLSVNQGNQTTYLDPYSLQKLSSFQTYQSPDNAATVAATLRGQNLTDARSREQIAMGKVPAGYRQAADGSLEFIPGGPADPNTPKSKANLTEDQGKATGWLVQAENAWKNMQAVGLDKSGKIASSAKPGLGDVVAGVGLESFGNALRSDDRQKYVQASSSLSEALLRAATGAGVNRDEAAQKIKEITPVLGDSNAVIQQKMAAIPLYLDSLRVRAGPGAVKADAIGEKTAAAPVPIPMKGMVRGGYKFKGGDPANPASWEKV